MGLVLVAAIAVAVGVLVFRLTAGGEERPRALAESTASGAADEAEAWAGGEVGGDTQEAGVVAPPERRLEAPEGYIPVASSGSSWYARLGGAMGLVIAVAVGAIALALSLWALGVFVARLLSDAGGGAPPAA